MYAHSQNHEGNRHLLVDHLRGTARRAGLFADAFGASELASLVALWHDLGKFNPEFQEYLLRCETEPSSHARGPDHKAAGAQLATSHLGLLGLLIQGHHGGLQAQVHLKPWLDRSARDHRVADALTQAEQALPDLGPAAPPTVPEYTRGDPRAVELFLRMVFSTLVDADYFDTEEHFDLGRTERRGSRATVAQLWDWFKRDQDALTRRGRGVVNQVRNDIYQACVEAAEQPPGLFRLTVPTGGGKTRSAMAFALRHALRHCHRRVIVAVPFLTITEQTAAVYQEIFETSADDAVVLEHHSAAARAEGEDFRAGRVWARLAAENWDAPMVVTTTVQLFPSLFSNMPSRTRKLHRLARSVIILDEAQSLPPHLLGPTLNALRDLCEHYGATSALSTATQPAFEAIKEFADLPATEIVPDPSRYFRLLVRVRYEWWSEEVSWEDVAGLMRTERQALAVVNTKKDALALLAALDGPEALHLSTMLCGAHRRRVIEDMRRRLADGEPCRLVSTQVIEAGVDLDFPLVLWAMGPLDGIMQSAGRCNREGRLCPGACGHLQAACPPAATEPQQTSPRRCSAADLLTWKIQTLHGTTSGGSSTALGPTGRRFKNCEPPSTTLRSPIVSV